MGRERGPGRAVARGTEEALGGSPPTCTAAALAGMEGAEVASTRHGGVLCMSS